MTTPSARAKRAHTNSLNDYRPIFPHVTLKCLGQPLFRSQQARDYACTLDLDREVVSWKCLATAFVNDDSEAIRPRSWHVDFAVETEAETFLVTVEAKPKVTPTWAVKIAERMGYRLQNLTLRDVDPVLLQNCKDLMRYAGAEVPLGDRIRVLAALEEYGTLTLAEALSIIRESRPMHSIAALILSGTLDVDLSEALLGPDSVLRRAAK
ncbi:MAG: hypothetical protein O9256_01530 [Rhizobiaceae bacterium]|nr:hypothetical protein [Rhizobiaceae bacterium]MCZ8352952.1 hypothetical protein [Rhizobium sp.]